MPDLLKSAYEATMAALLASRDTTTTDLIHDALRALLLARERVGHLHPTDTDLSGEDEAYELWAQLSEAT